MALDSSNLDNYSLEAAVVFADGPAATETLAALWASKGDFQLQKYVDRSKIFWHPGITP
ncbi:hypothetical protein ACLB1E_14505 [Escherichia coli]